MPKTETRLIHILLFFIYIIPFKAKSENKPLFFSGNKTKVISGSLKGSISVDGVLSFKGIPYAAAPVGKLRWKAPQPVKPWSGERDATNFGARPMQKSNLLYEFRSDKMSEDCLFLNVWTPAKSNQERRAVYVFIHGGSFIHGDGSQPAYDGESMARKGIVYVSINYRLGVFGFMSHPELSKESGYRGSGNYGLLDQLAALKWVKENIEAFGGDPDRVTVGGESVGAQSVNAHLVSPLSRGYYTAAIAESGSLLDSRKLILSLDSSEKMGTELSKITKTESIEQLRAIPADELLNIVTKGNPRRFKPVIDHYFIKEHPQITFDKGQQANVPLLTGWNAQEVPAATLFRLRKINDKNYQSAVKRIYKNRADEVLKLYPSGSNNDVRKSSGELMSDRLINYSSWKLAQSHAKSAKAPVYLYLFSHPHPGLNQRTIREGNFFQVILKKLINRIIAGTSFHASEIEYALGNLDVQDNYAWSKKDYEVSKQFQQYFVNFINTGNPNLPPTHPDLIKWPEYKGENGSLFIAIKSETEILTEENSKRFEFFESLVE